METALTVSLFLAAVMWLLFSGWYLVRATWWKSPFGWNTIGVSLVLTVIYTRLAFLYMVPTLKADLLFTGLVLYVASAVLGAHRIFLLERAQRNAQEPD